MSAGAVYCVNLRHFFVFWAHFCFAKTALSAAIRAFSAHFRFNRLRGPDGTFFPQ
jgi:hypothetical protein